MTSDQIKTYKMQEYGVDYQPLWLQEIAYQLAVMNEHAAIAPLIQAELAPQKLTTPMRQYSCRHRPTGPECGPCHSRRTFGSPREKEL